MPLFNKIKDYFYNVGTSLLLNDKFISSFSGKMLIFYLRILFCIRAFFIRDNPIFVYIIFVIILGLKMIFPHFLSYGQSIFVWLYIGVQLILYDNLLSSLSEFLYKNPESLVSVTLLTPSKSSNMILRHFSGKVILGAIFGKTPMSSTGRAALGCAVITSIGLGVNDHLNRASAERIAAEQLASHERIATEQLASHERIEHDKLQLERDKLAFEKHKYTEQMSATKRSGWGWFRGK